MKKDKDIIFDSTYENVNVFIENHKDIFILIDLSLYISGNFVNKPPNNIQKEFIDEFFGNHEWAVFINESKNKNTFFSNIPPFDLPTIRGILNHELLKLIKYNKDKLVSKNEKKLIEEKEDLKRKLKLAIDYSFDENGVFWKDDGWCNVRDVLLYKNLIELK